MNNYQYEIDSVINFWTGRAVMRWYLGYESASITIENVDSHFDPSNWPDIMEAQDVILTSLAALYVAAPWTSVDELLSLYYGHYPDMSQVREVLAYNSRGDGILVNDEDEVFVSQHDALLYYWDLVKAFMPTPLMAGCCACIREALSASLSLSGEAIDLLLDAIEANYETID